MSEIKRSPKFYNLKEFLEKEEQKIDIYTFLKEDYTSDEKNIDKIEKGLKKKI